MTAAERQRAWRARRRRGVRSYLVRLPDTDLGEMIDRGAISEADALDPEMVAETIVRLAKSAMQKTVMRDAASAKSMP